jgi:hypothetical protein
VEKAHHVKQTVVIAEHEAGGDIEVPKGFGKLLGAILVGGRQ